MNFSFSPNPRNFNDSLDGERQALTPHCPSIASAVFQFASQSITGGSFVNFRNSPPLTPEQITTIEKIISNVEEKQLLVRTDQLKWALEVVFSSLCSSSPCSSVDSYSVAETSWGDSLNPSGDPGMWGFLRLELKHPGSQNQNSKSHSEMIHFFGDRIGEKPLNLYLGRPESKDSDGNRISSIERFWNELVVRYSIPQIASAPHPSTYQRLLEHNPAIRPLSLRSFVDKDLPRPDPVNSAIIMPMLDPVYRIAEKEMMKLISTINDRNASLVYHESLVPAAWKPVTADVKVLRAQLEQCITPWTQRTLNLLNQTAVARMAVPLVFDIDHWCVREMHFLTARPENRRLSAPLSHFLTRMVYNFAAPDKQEFVAFGENVVQPGEFESILMREGSTRPERVSFLLDLLSQNLSGQTLAIQEEIHEAPDPSTPKELIPIILQSLKWANDEVAALKSQFSRLPPFVHFPGPKN